LRALGWLFYKILDSARMCFSSVRYRGSARTGRRPRKLNRFSLELAPVTTEVCVPLLRARAPTVFSVRMKSVSVQKTLF
jgi:hypothetical protein